MFVLSKLLNIALVAIEQFIHCIERSFFPLRSKYFIRRFVAAVWRTGGAERYRL